MTHRSISYTIALLLLAGATPSVGADEGWIPLLTADSLSEWNIEGESKASFRMEGDVVIGQPIGHNPKNSFLCSPREYENFDLKFDFQIEPRSLNSGVQFRSHVRDDGVVAGPQLEMEVEDPSDLGFTRRYLFPLLVRLTSNPWRPRHWAAGGVYGESLETGWIFPGVAGGDASAFQEQGERLTRPTDWNELRIRADGPRVQTWLNGEPRADFEHAETARSGHICLQVHGGQYEDPSLYSVRWRGLLIREP